MILVSVFEVNSLQDNAMYEFSVCLILVLIQRRILIGFEAILEKNHYLIEFISAMTAFAQKAELSNFAFIVYDVKSIHKIEYLQERSSISFDLI